MNQAVSDAQKEKGIEYSIYTLGMPASGAQGQWTIQGTLTDMTAALVQAESLLKTGKYKKIEVKQKYFDKKTNRNIDMTLKTFDARKKFEVNLAVTVVLALLCGVAAFAITYFFTR